MLQTARPKTVVIRLFLVLRMAGQEGQALREILAEVICRAIEAPKHARAIARCISFLLLLTAGLVLSGCNLAAFGEKPQPETVISIRNDLDEPIRVRYELPPSDPGAEVAAGGGELFTFDLVASDPARRCTTSAIVLTMTDGQVLGRIPPPACLNTTFVVSDWVGN